MELLCAVSKQNRIAGGSKVKKNHFVLRGHTATASGCYGTCQRRFVIKVVRDEITVTITEHRREGFIYGCLRPLLYDSRPVYNIGAYGNKTY